MAYTKTSWVDRQVQYPMTFTMSTAANGGTTLTANEGTVTQAGTPLSATALNNLETQYDQAVTDIENWVKSFGLGSNSQSPPGNDLNSITTTGFYQASGTTANSPNSTVSWNIIHIQKDSTPFASQLALRISDNQIYFRYLNGGSGWSAWSRYASFSDLTSQNVNVIPADSKVNTDPPTAFPFGVSIMEVTNSGDGYPGAYLGTLMTNNVNANRVSQTFIAKSNPYTYVRSGDSGMANGWGNWVRMASYNDFTVSLGANGYQKLPSGLIIQWGRLLSVPNGVLTQANLPITFPTSFLQATAGIVNASGGCGWNPTSTSQIGIIQTQGSARDVSYIAIGY